MKILFFLIFFSFIVPQIAYGSEISGVPEKAIFGPNDSSEAQIPDWVKNTTRWWADGLISDQEFANGIKFLVISDIIQV